jgi:hypothetical protein
MLEFTERMARDVAIAQAQAIGYVWGVQYATRGDERERLERSLRKEDKS